MTFDPRSFRNALGCFATGITVVATRVGGTPIGMTVNSFTSVSLDPPLVLFCVARDSQNFDAFATADAFAFSILAEDQQEISARFARRDLQDRFTGVGFDSGVTGSPLLHGALASLDCRRERAIEMGDHSILVGRVVDLRMGKGRPLLYFRGGYAQVE